MSLTPQAPSSPAPAANLSSVLNSWGEPLSAIRALPALEHASKRLPYCLEDFPLPSLADPEALATHLSMSLVLLSTTHNQRSWTALFEDDSSAVVISAGNKSTATLYATSKESLARLSNLLSTLEADPTTTPADGTLDLTLTYRNDRWNEVVPRSIRITPWESIRRNYESRAQRALDELMAIRSPQPQSGGLILIHGPAGTGKTTALRALITEWASWCTASYILDPGQLFSQTEYLNSLVFNSSLSLRDPTSDPSQGRWRLFIIEDADEILGGEKINTAMSRILNLTDGLMGHEINTLFCITTNQRLSTINDALSRPGRAMAEIEIPRFPVFAARAWLGPNHHGPMPTEPPSLAELYALSGSLPHISTGHDQQISSGQYL